jgi:hypothetical protein
VDIETLQDFVLPVDQDIQNKFQYTPPQFSLEFKSGLPNSDSRLAIPGYKTSTTYRCGAITEDTNVDITGDVKITGTIGSTAPSYDSSSTTKVVVGLGQKGTKSYPESLGSASFKHLCLCDRDEMDQFSTTTVAVKSECAVGGTGSNTMNEKSLGNFGITIGRVWFAKALMLPRIATYNGEERRAPYMFHHFTAQKSDAATFTMQGVPTADSTQTPFSAEDYVGIAEEQTFTDESVPIGNILSPVCGYVPITHSTAVTPGSSGDASVALSTSSISFATENSNGLATYKYIVCLCRSSVTGSCEESAISSYFNMAGYLHVVDATIPQTFAVTSEKTYTDLYVTFTKRPDDNSRFALVPASEDKSSNCGAYQYLAASNPSNIPNWGLYESVVSTGTNLDDITTYEILSGMRPKNTSGYVLSSEDYSNENYGFLTVIPSMRFMAKGSYEICYCGTQSEGVCDSIKLADRAAAHNNWAYYQTYGASLGSLSSSAFLTHTSSQTFTVPSEGSSQQLNIWKTSTSSLTYSEINDKWTLTLAENTCGDQNAPSVSDKTLGIFTATLGPSPPAFSPCDTAANQYECNLTSKYMSTDAASGYFTGLSNDVFKLCLCSASGTAKDSSCDTTTATGLRDYSDHAGYVYIVDGAESVSEQNVVVNVDDATAQMTVKFGSKQVVTSDDRLGLIPTSKMCGDAAFDYDAMFASTTLADTTYTVGESGTDQTLTSAALTFMKAGLYKICYCSDALENSCDTSADYGIQLGTLVVNDISFTDTRLVASTLELSTLTTKISYEANGLFSTADHMYFTSADSCPATAGTASATQTDVVPKTTSGATYSFDFTSAEASDTAWRLCLSTGASLYAQVESVNVWVSDLTTSPRVTTRDASVSVEFTYTDIVKFSTQEVYYLSNDLSCGDSNLPTSKVSTGTSTGVHNVPSSAGTIDFDFSNTEATAFHICLAEGCDTNTPRSCTNYYDLSNVESTMIAYESLSITPMVVQNTIAETITIAADGTLASGLVWFQRNATGLCVEPTAASEHSSSKVAITGSGAMTFDFSQVTDINQDLFQLCAVAITGETPVAYGVGIRVVDISVTPQTLTPAQHMVSIKNAAGSSATTSIAASDYIYFTTGECSAVPPSASSVSTETRVFASDTTEYSFDFSGILNGEAKLCVVPTSSNTASVYDYQGTSTSISIVDVKISPSAVTRSATLVPITFTYGSGTFNESQGSLFFAADCTDVVAANHLNSNQNLPASGVSIDYDVDVGTPAAQQALFNLCYKDSNGVIIQYTSIGIHATSVAVSPTAVSKSESQDLKFTFVASELIDTNVVSFVQSSFACSAGTSETSTPQLTVSGVGGAGTDWTGNFDFSLTTISAESYRMCVFDSTGALVMDLTNIEVFVLDLSMQPSASSGATTTYKFTSEDGMGQAPSSSIVAGDTVWMEAQSAPSFSGCVDTPPTSASGTSTSSLTVTNDVEYYTFDFDSATYYGDWILCASRDGVTRSYENVAVYIADIEQDKERIDALDGAVSLTLDYTEGSLAFTGVNYPDKLFFLRNGAELCEEYAEAAELASSSAHSKATVLDFGHGHPQALTFDFSNTAASDTSFRLCVVRYEPSRVIDLSGQMIVVQDLKLSQDSVFNLPSQTIVIEVTAGLIVGDTVFFSTTPCTGYDNKVTFNPTESTTTTSDSQNVISVEAGISSLVFDFSAVTSDSTLKMCILRLDSLVAQESFEELLVLDGAVPALGSNSDASAIYGVVRQGPSPSFKFVASSITSVSSAKLTFVESVESCPSAPLSAGSRTSSASVTVIDFNDVTFDFTTASLATNLYRLCVLDGANAQTEYSGVGVVVSDLTIMGSSSSDLNAVGCVDSAASQSITFSITSSNVFDSSSTLYFKRYVSGDAACGSIPNASTTSTSAPVLMGILDISSSVDGVISWTQMFDFTNSEASMSVYRLCVMDSNGVSVDFSPLGVRISDVSISTSSEAGQNAFAPLAGQTVSIAADVSLAVNDEIFFIDSSVKNMACDCGYDNNCPTLDASPVSDKVTITATEATTYTVNFAAFAASSSASMCVKSSSSSEIYGLECKSVSFAVTVSPPSVPANDEQFLALSFNGVSLLADDEVMWTSTDATCDTTTNFTTASTDNSFYYSSSAKVVASDAVLSFNFDKSMQGNTLVLCVKRDVGGVNTVYKLLGTTILVTAHVSVVSVGGDPHVRAADGKWLDFYGEAGVYNLLDSDNMQANAKFGYAVRDNHMIWHPKVMRPGTLMEEVGIKLLDEKVNIRLAVHGGGIVSIRKAAESTQFWTGVEDHVIQMGDYTITWAACQKSCETVMPWGSHERSRSLTVEGRGEFLQMFVANSGGYRFVDIEAMPSHAATGLLADAQGVPAALAARLMSGGEKDYKIMSSLVESY